MDVNVLTRTEKRIWDLIKGGGYFNLSFLAEKELLFHSNCVDPINVVSVHLTKMTTKGFPIHRSTRGRMLFVGQFYPVGSAEFLPPRQQEFYDFYQDWRTNKAVALQLYGRSDEKTFELIRVMRNKLLQKFSFKSRIAGPRNMKEWRIVNT